MSDKITIARIKKAGQTFEISVDTDMALEFKKGHDVYIHNILQADNIFLDVHKGMIAPAEALAKAFQTVEVDPILVLTHPVSMFHLNSNQSCGKIALVKIALATGPSSLRV